ncbi:uncharacterized protein [Palaemon carinicauda]|uniref:uncharacterized protein n=1 Tax=Palaemon carinicauda TaxID=392227 RepID=UPI0035B593A5
MDCCGSNSVYPESPSAEPIHGMSFPDSKSEGIVFTVNGRICKVGPDIPPWTRLVDFLRDSNLFLIESLTVGPDIPPWTRLVDFLRDRLVLKGTKVLCREAGCGLCTVVATMPDQENPGGLKTYSIQSCLTFVYACAGWNIQTIESLGSRYKGYNPLQTALHGFSGTQCGYCSPGMIMTMYGQMQKGPLTSEQVEKSLDGNLCRCTGYRPILDAFKSLAEDADENLKSRLVDIEDAYKGTCNDACARNCGDCKHLTKELDNEEQTFKAPAPKENLSITSAGVAWHRPRKLRSVYEVLNQLKDQKARIVVGNTGQGIYKNDGPYSHYICTHGILELYYVGLGEPLILSANVSLARAIEVFQEAAESMESYRHMEEVAKHWKLVANVSVRNTASWAGNLMLKNQHREFPSDIFLTLAACGTEVTVGDAQDGSVSSHTLEDFLEVDMHQKLILYLVIPPSEKKLWFRSFKITPRAVNAHAYVNACFSMTIDVEDGFRIIDKPRILYGGINPNFVHAQQTENFLINRRLMDKQTLANALGLLANEVHPDQNPRDSNPEFRRSLALSLFYKAIVGFLGEAVSPRIASAGPNIERPLSSGEQSFEMDEVTWPVGEPIPKLESASQISGEAVFLDDIPAMPNELHAAFVLSAVAKARLANVDPSEALKLEGVMGFVSADDIVGQNSFVKNISYFFPTAPDPVFVADNIKYAGQPIGVVVARDRDTAVRGTRLVRVQYDNIKKPILTIQEAIENGKKVIGPNISTGKMEPYEFGNYEEAKDAAPNSVQGDMSFGYQYHLCMESHAARVIPIDGGYDVYSTTQWPTETQNVVSQVLDVPANRINVTVRRLGGAYGAKVSRQNIVAAAAAIAARKLERPVRMVVDLNTQMTYSGLREPYQASYEVSFDDEGKITALKMELISDVGHLANEASVFMALAILQNTYHIPNMMVTPFIVTTDTPANTWCRTPGHVECIGAIETVMDHIAHALGKDPLEVREVNMAPPNVPRFLAPPLEKNVVVDDILPLLKEKANYEERKTNVEEFNQANLFKKRGLSIIPMWYEFNYPPMFRFGVQVTVYELDGTVALSIGGIEMGQGINTKVAQVAAYTLGVPLEYVVVKHSDSMIGANSSATGGSFGSDLCCHGIRVACNSLRDRMEVVRELMKEDDEEEPSWEKLVKKCYAENVDLSERFWTNSEHNPESYDIWGACCLEVEIDALTGVYVIHRADIIEDSGRSLNPYVDVGQVEGAFIMGLGFYTSELIKIHQPTGQRISNGTWEYKPPTALDIPVDMRVTLLPNPKTPKGVLSSKATGEPPLCLAYAVVAALRQAIASYRAEFGVTDWFAMNAPVTVQKVHTLCQVNPSQMVLDDPKEEEEA